MLTIIKKYLEKNNYLNQQDDFQEFFLSHPNYPSVYAVTDSLDSLSIPNLAIKLPKEQFEALPDFFLAVFKEELVLVSKKDATVTLENKEGKKKNVSFNEFLTDWSQVVIVIEPNETINLESGKANAKWLQYILPLVVLMAISLIYNEYNSSSILLLITSFVGLVASVFILQEKFGYSNAVVSKICNINPNTSCNSVIKSDTGKRWVQFSDLPFLFFGISIMSIILQPKDTAVIIGFLSILSLPVILYSLWLQKFQLKKWCVLCLVVSFIVVAQGFVFVLDNHLFSTIFSVRFFEFLFVAFLFTSLWMLVKPVFEVKITTAKKLVESMKFKRNYDLFKFLSKDITTLHGFNQLKGLSFGNNDADVQLTLIISPSCGHCHKAFEDAYELVSKFPQKIFLNILFNINPENNENPYKIVVESLLAIDTLFPEKTEEAIVDWHINKMVLEEWKQKWIVESIDMETNRQLRLQYNWCLENGFNYTPVKLINNKLFPQEYEINELKYFLNDFSEEKELMENNILIQA